MVACLPPHVVHASNFLLYSGRNSEWDCGCFIQYHWFPSWWVLLADPSSAPSVWTQTCFFTPWPNRTPHTPLTWPEPVHLWQHSRRRLQIFIFIVNVWETSGCMLWGTPIINTFKPIVTLQHIFFSNEKISLRSFAGYTKLEGVASDQGTSVLL